MAHFYPFHNNLDNYKDSTAHATPGNGGYTIQPTTNRNSITNKALKFPNDANIYTIKLPNQTMNGLNSFTVSLWINFEVFQTQSCFFSVAKSGANRDNEFLFCHNTIVMYQDRIDVSSPPTQTGTWMHLAFVRNHSTGQAQFYIDGTLKQTGSGFTDTLVAEGVHFGAD